MVNVPKYGARGSGRTTQMLQQALATNQLGAPLVFVIGWRDQDCLHMMDMMLDMPAIRGALVAANYTQRTLTVGTGRIAFRAGRLDNFDWIARRILGHDPLTPVFIDHYAEEMHAEQERRRAIDAERTARLAATRAENKARARVLQGPVASDAPMADFGTQEVVLPDLSGDASSSCGGSESSGGSCGTD